MTVRRVVVVGASLAGLRTAQELRRQGFDGEIEVLGEEDLAPYDRPPLSKQVLTGQRSAADVRLSSPEECAEAGITLRLGVRAAALEPERHRIRTDDGDELGYDAVVLATGVRARRLPGTDLPEIHTLRTLLDSLSLHNTLRSCGHLVVVGGGFIGAEVAAVARGLGVEATLVEATAAPLARAVGEQLGAAMTDLHRDQGVKIRTGAPFTGMVGAHRVEGVRIGDDTVLPCDAVLVGVGTVPNTQWLDGAGLDTVDGIRCDHAGRALGAADVYAVGDVARWHDPARGTATRVEHWTNAVEQARVVASRLVDPHGVARREPGLPYFWSDQYGIKIQFVGHRTDHVEVLDGSLSDRRFLAVYLDAHQRVTGALAFDRPRLVGMAKRWIGEGRSVDEVQQALPVSG